jgi:hypothetical protein
MALPEAEVHTFWQEVKKEFGGRHAKTRDFLHRRFEQVRPFLPGNESLSEERQLLLGAYFSHEYSLEAAALFNPSIVPHPDQSDLPSWRVAFHSEPPGHGRRSYLLDHISHRIAGCRQQHHDQCPHALLPRARAGAQRLLREARIRAKASGA